MAELFGKFLIDRGAATQEEVLRALDEQRKRRLPLGTVAVQEKFLTYQDVYTVLNAQADAPDKHFGELAVELGLLTPEALGTLLALQQERTPHVGEILVEMGVLDPQRLVLELNAFMRRLQEGAPPSDR